MHQPIPKLLAVRQVEAAAPRTIPKEPRQPASDFPIVQAAAHFPRSRPAHASFSLTLYFSMM